jgi:hypothetical protein
MLWSKLAISGIIADLVDIELGAVTKVLQIGGFNSTARTTIDYITTTSDSMSVYNSVLSQGKHYAHAVTSATKTYVAGGSAASAVDALLHSNQSRSTISATYGVYGGAYAKYISGNCGYFAGGYTTTFINTVNKLDFSSENISGSSAYLSIPRRFLAGTYSSASMYCFGGTNGSHLATIDGFTYASESTLSSSASLSPAKSAICCASLSSKGLIFEGIAMGTNNYQGNAEQYNYLSSSISTVNSSLTTRAYISCGNNNDFAYISGGVSVAVTYLSFVEKYDIASNSLAFYSSSLTLARRQACGAMH